MKFIRKNGRIIPIKGNTGSTPPAKKPAKKVSKPAVYKLLGFSWTKQAKGESAQAAALRVIGKGKK